jgi:hypothetical protein
MTSRATQSPVGHRHDALGAYLSPIVLERLVAHRRPSSLSIKDLIAAAERPWCEQEVLVFEN